jgi:L-fuculose-phosphate aldolase
VPYWDLKRKIVDVMRFMDDRGLNYCRAGNVSVRVDKDEVLITPSGVVKSAMSPEDIVLVSVDGRVLEGRHKPTVEMPLHLAIYKSYKHVKAVIHAHPTYTSVLAVARAPLPPIIGEMILYTGGDVRAAERPVWDDGVGQKRRQGLRGQVCRYTREPRRRHGR